MSNKIEYVAFICSENGQVAKKMPFSYIGWHVLIIECQMSKNNFRPLLCHHVTLGEIIFEREFLF